MLTMFFMLYLTALVGVNLKELLDNATEGSQKLLDFSDRLGDRIQVFLE